MNDVREDVAKYYDLQDNPTDDIGFYQQRLVAGRWGGYRGQAWGEGPELVIAFCAT